MHTLPERGNFASSDPIYISVAEKEFLFAGGSGILSFSHPSNESFLIAESEYLSQAKKINLNPLPLFPDPAPDAFFIHPAGTCNLNCSYCINSGGTMGKPEKMMTPKTARHTADFIAACLEENNERPVAVTITGGEPFMNPRALAELLKGLLKIKRRCSGRLTVRLDTNGTIYDEKVAALVSEGAPAFSLAISIDGKSERHDRHRKTKDGGHSWNLVRENAARFKQAGLPFTVTAVVPDPFQFAETTEELLSLGYRRFQVKEMIPYSYGAKSSINFDASVLDVWKSGYMKYADYCLQRLEADEKDPAAREHLDLVAGSAAFAYLSAYPLACDLMVGQTGISPEGDLYPCDSLNYTEFKLGSVEGGWERKKVDRFWQRLISQGQMGLENSECRNCLAWRFCGGGCYAISWDRAKRFDSINQDFCLITRERVKIDLYTLGELARLHPGLLCSVHGLKAENIGRHGFRLHLGRQAAKGNISQG